MTCIVSCSSDFYLISWRLFDRWMSYFATVSQCDANFDLKINLGHSDLYFIDSALHLEDYVMDTNFGIMSQGDAMDDLIINVGHSDLCFKVHWFCFISLWEFHGWMSYFGTMSQCDATTDHIIDVCHGDLYFTLSSEFSSYFEDNTMDSCLALWLRVLVMHYKSWWPIFYGPVILSYILKVIWWMNIILWDNESVWHKVFLILNVGHGDLDFMFHLILFY